MAISTMKKVSLLSKEENFDAILQSLQEAQIVEVIDVQEQNIDDAFFHDDLQQKKKQQLEKEIVHLNDDLKAVQRSITFVERYGNLKKNKHSFKRTVLSFEELTKQSQLTEIPEMIRTIDALSEERETLEQQLDSLRDEEEIVQKWRRLDVDPKEFKTLKFAETFLVDCDLKKYEEFQQSLSSKFPLAQLEEISRDVTDAHLFILVKKEEKRSLVDLFNDLGVQIVHPIHHGRPETNYQTIQKERVRLQKELHTLYRKIGKQQSALVQLFLAEEVFLAKIARKNTLLKMCNSPSLQYGEVWLPLENEEKFLSSVSPFVESGQLVIEEDSIETTKIEEIPIQLTNNKWVAPFEKLTAMYALPKYDEIDPTPWMMPFYLVFFGMMVADIGYGLILLLATTIAKRCLVLPRGFKSFIDFFQIVAIPTILWGFIYSSFFGMELLKSIGGISLPFPLLSTSEDVNTILLLSLCFGFIQIMVGLGLASALHIKKKQYIESVSEGFAWQGVLLGILFVVLGEMVFHQDVLQTLGIILAGISAFSIIFAPVLTSKNKVKGFVKGLYNFYGISGYIGDLVSYTRLMALGISGGCIAAAFNLLVGFLPTPLKFTLGILLIIVLQSLNLFLSYLGAYVHSARLQYVEFFGKFFNGGGRAFSPLKPEEKHVNIEGK